jgi:hypothetical protein
VDASNGLNLVNGLRLVTVSIDFEVQFGAVVDV